MQDLTQAKNEQLVAFKNIRYSFVKPTLDYEALSSQYLQQKIISMPWKLKHDQHDTPRN